MMAPETTRVGYEPCPATAELMAVRMTRPDFAPHFHDRYTIGIVTAGGGRLLNGGRLLRLQAGDIFIQHPYEVHSGEAKQGMVEYRAIFPDGDFLTRHRPANAAGLPHFSRPVIRDAPLSKALRAGLEQHGARLDSALATLLSTHAAWRPAGASGSPPGRAAIGRACRCMAARPQMSVDMTTLATEVGLSRAHFARLFRALTGETPAQWFRTLRISLGHALLHNGVTPPVAAAAAGFADTDELHVALQHPPLQATGLSGQVFAVDRPA